MSLPSSLLPQVPSSGMSELTEPLRIRALNFPFVSGAIFMVTLVTTFTLYGFEGRFEGYLPTVSETAINYPNTYIFCSMMSVEAIVLFLIYSIYIAWSEIYGFFGQKTTIFCQIIAFICPICLIGLSAFPFNENPQAHYGFALTFFVLAYAFYVPGIGIMWKHLHGPLFVFRIAVVGLAVFLIIAMILIFNFLANSVAMTALAVCEVVFLFNLVFFLFTFKAEFKTLKIDFVIYPETVVRIQ